MEHKLPDGRTIRVARKDARDCMLKYLQSDAYRKATNEELSKGMDTVRQDRFHA